MAANRIGDDIQDQIIEMALEADATNLSPRELALRFTDEKRYFVSESTVYRLLKAHDLITSPAFVVIKAADQFHTKTTRPNEMWQTDFTYFKIIGWGWMYLSTVLDDFSRYIIAWKLCTNMLVNFAIALTLGLAHGKQTKCTTTNLRQFSMGFADGTGRRAHGSSCWPRCIRPVRRRCSWGHCR